MSDETVVAPAVPASTAPAAAPSAPPAPANNQAEGGQAPAQNEADKASAAKPDGEKPDTEQDREKQRGSRRFERKIDRLHRRAAEAEARAALYERQLNEAKQRQAPEDPGAPRLEQFDDIEKYAQAKAKYEADRVVRDLTAKQQAELAKQQQQRVTTEWEEKVGRAESKYEDFDEIVGELAPTTPLSLAIMRAENGEDVAYYLGRNLKEAEQLASLDPFSQVLAIGRLSAKLAAEPPKPIQPSKAPAPINPLSGAAGADAKPTPDKDFGAWMKMRQKQEGKRVA